MKKIICLFLCCVLVAHFSYEMLFESKVGSYPPPQITSQADKEYAVNKADKVGEVVNSKSANFTPEAKNILNTKISEVSSANPTTTNNQEKPKSANYGMTEAVDTNANPQVASVAEALKSSKYPERLSPLIQPKAFDRVAFEKDPLSYLQVIEPGRVFQALNPAVGVPVIQRISESFVVIQQLEKTVLKVKAIPFMPVTFTSFDLGSFQNKLTSITVQADKEGLAEAAFFAAEGTIADCNILASCPVTSGRIKFIVNIQKNNLFNQEN